jgi:hypothetical protein
MVSYGIILVIEFRDFFIRVLNNQEAVAAFEE